MSFIDGKQLQRNLEKLSEKTEQNYVVSAVRAGAAYYAKTVRKKIPRSNNDDVVLKKSIKAKRIRTRKGSHYVRSIVGIKGDAKKYAHVFEFGRSDGAKYSGKKVFTDTLEQSKAEIFQAMKKKLAIRLARHGRG